jgi:hypothetical protein
MPEARPSSDCAMPPSTSKSMPVIKPLSSEAKKWRL